MRKPSRRDWFDLDTTSDIIGELAAPPASVHYLGQAEAIVHDVATAPYACPGHMYDAQGERTHAAVLPLGVNHWRVAFTRCRIHGSSGTQQSPTLLTSASSGATAADVVTVPAQTVGTYGYMDVTGTTDAVVKHQRSGAQVDDTPAATKDRQLELAETLRPTVEEYSITSSAGHCVFVSGRTQDLETL